MSDSWLNTDSAEPAAAFRPGTEYLGHQLFSDGDRAVLVEPETVRSLREAAEQAAPDETGGLLYGRTGSDENGRYVLISDFVQVGPDVSRTGGFKFVPGDTQQLRDKADRKISTDADEVGWWHSHAQPSPYTPADLDIQGRFDWPDSVGLLVFAAGLQWAAAYRGPGAVDLGQPVELTEDERPALLEGEPGTVGTVSRLTGPLPQLPARAARPPGPPGGRPPWLPRVRTVAIGVAVILLAVVVMGVIDAVGHIRPYTPTAKSSSASPTVTASTPAPVPTTAAPAPATQPPSSPATAPASGPAPNGVPTLAGSYCEENEFASGPGVYSCFANVQPPAWSSEVTWVSADGKFLGAGIQVTIRARRSETVYVIVGPASRPLAREPVSVSPN